MKYQENYSNQFEAVKDEESRRKKAIKILRILQDFMGYQAFSDLTCLDMGCSVGIISSELSNITQATVGLDIDRPAIRQGNASKGSNSHFLVSDVGKTPFPDEAFDIIICSQVYEHTPDFEALIDEIYRLLKPTGVCFFSGPNKWAVWEEHYDLPFLSWLPRRWANRYLQLTNKSDEYYEMPRSARELRIALERFEIHDYTLKLIHKPEQFMMESQVGILRNIPNWVLLLLYNLLPNFNWILTK